LPSVIVYKYIGRWKEGWSIAYCMGFQL